MTPHSSTVAWKIPWTEEPGRLQSMGSLGVGHDWVTLLSLFTFIHRRRKWQPTPVFLPGESQGRGSLVGCCLWGHTESDMTEVTQQQHQTFQKSTYRTRVAGSTDSCCLSRILGKLFGCTFVLYNDLHQEDSYMQLQLKYIQRCLQLSSYKLKLHSRFIYIYAYIYLLIRNLFPKGRIYCSNQNLTLTANESKYIH